MHEKTSVPALIEELYTFLRQADARELGMIFREIDAARAAGDSAKERELLDKAENYETHVVPIIADIDAGFGNAEATYLLAKKMIEAGACALQIKTEGRRGGKEGVSKWRFRWWADPKKKNQKIE